MIIIILSTIVENIIGTLKRQNNFWWGVIVNYSNIAIAILDFALLLFQLFNIKIVPFNIFTSFSVSVLYIGLWLLFCIYSFIVRENVATILIKQKSLRAIALQGAIEFNIAI